MRLRRSLPCSERGAAARARCQPQRVKRLLRRTVMCCPTFRIDPTLGIRFGLVGDRILDAACKVFQQRGIQGASVREIVDVAHTNKVSFYRHFASKDELIAEILPKVAADLWKLSDSIAAKRMDDPGLRLEGLFRAYLCNGDLAIPLGCLFAKAATTESGTDA